MTSMTTIDAGARRKRSVDEGWYDLRAVPVAGAARSAHNRQARAGAGTRRPMGPASFTWSAKTITSAMAITSVIGLWNGIGHMEAGRIALQVASAEQQARVSESTVALAVPPLQIPPLPALSIDLSSVDAAMAQGARADVQPVMPAAAIAAVPPALDPLPSLPDLPSRPVVQPLPSLPSQPVQSAPQVSRRSRGS